MTDLDRPSRLSERFLNPPPGAANRSDCPDAEFFLRAIRRELPLGERRRWLDHVAACSACTVGWRVARELESEFGPAERGLTVERSRVWLTLVAALAGVAVLLSVWRSSGPAAGPREVSEQERTASDGARVESLIPAALERDASQGGVEFRWRVVPEQPGARYRFVLSTDDLDVLLSANGLIEPTQRVPAELFDRLERPTVVMWRVDVLLPGGAMIAGPTFRLSIP